MTLVREYQPTFVLGDGETKEFSYLFEEVSENFIKVIVKHSDDSTYVPVFSVDLDSHKVVFGESETAPLDTDLVCIYRETPDLQDTPFRTLQGYDAKALENILSKIVAMIQELKANGFSTQILQGMPWQLDLLHPDDNGASVVVDYNARILKKGLYFQIVSGNLQVSADGSSFITMPKSADITEFRRLETVLEDLTVQYRLQYKVDGVWYNAESNAEATADEALQVAQDAKDIAQAASDKVDTFDVRLTIAEGDASDAKQDASDAKELAEDTAETVSGFDGRITQAEQNATDAKSIAQTTSGNLTTHTSNTNNPHQVTKAQVGLGNVDNTSDLDKPISTATQTALNGKQATISDLATIRSNAQAGKAASDTIATYGDIVTHDVAEFATAAQGAKADTAVQPNDVGNGTITITQGGTTKGTFTTNQGGNTTIDIDAGGGGSGLNVGDTFMTMRTDNELNGAVECDGATYNTTDFIGAQSIGALLEAGKLDYISLSAYSTAISTKGWCDKIGWNGTGNTQFRVPTLNAHIVQTNNIPVVGNGMTLGLTDGTDTAGINSYANSTGLDPWTGLYGTSVGTASSGSRVTANKSMGITTDPTKSGMVTDTSDVAQLRVMIQLATGATDTALETCTSVLADVATLKGYDYVVESQLPTAANNYTWYRKYKSGWVEQGGLNHTISLNSNGYNNMIDLPITMADTQYFALAILSGAYGNRTIGHVPSNSTTTQVCIGGYASQAGTSAINWQVSGMSAS